MLSRREEEKNEKIIRGLMKLPPNRKCINCNSLGPQYVCINFWTFVCMTCSGIHREFTHRVKSVSMAKFTSQEVESLQNGGNQRAREIYLRDWDLQRQRLPDNSNVDKVREFIRSVYVDNKYSGGKNSERPPRDLQRLKSQEDDKRRASSYHSYSQSPPYDHQYEDRRYGKPGAVLTRKGSDRGIYEGKVSGFVYSPHSSVRSHDERFANEISRSPDYSVSSGGDPFRSGNHSPVSQGNFGFGSPPINPSEEILVEDQSLGIHLDGKRDSVKNLYQKTTSSGSLASVKSTSSAGFVDVTMEPGQTMISQQDNGLLASSVPQPSYSTNSSSLSFFELPDAPLPLTALPVDFFQSSTAPAPSSVNLIQTNSMPTPPSTGLQHAHTSPPSFLDLFADFSKELPAAATSDKIESQPSMPKNEGWATFDIAQSMTSALGTGNMASTKNPSSNEDALGKFNNVFGPSMPWSSVQDTSADGVYPSVSIPWNENASRTQTFANTTGAETWNAFGDSVSSHHWESINQDNQQQFAAFGPSSVSDQYLGLGFQETLNEAGAYRTAAAFGDQVAIASSHVSTCPSHTPLASTLMETSLPATELNSTNPFDLPFESSLGTGSMFLDMSSVQAALPNASSSPFLGEVAQPWFSQHPVAPFLPDTTEGGLAYLGGQAPNSQLPNVQVQAPIASMGGNPFA